MTTKRDDYSWSTIAGMSVAFGVGALVYVSLQIGWRGGILAGISASGVTVLFGATMRWWRARKQVRSD